MGSTTVLDLLDDGLTESQKITVNMVYDQISSDTSPRTRSQGSRATTFGNTKSLLEFYDLVRQAINDYESRSGISEVNQVTFTEEEPDEKSQTESIVFSLINRVPGQFAQGKPMSRENINLRPMFREEFDDLENPGYRKVALGYYYDNIVRFTSWARTNKSANTRAEWFEDFMEEYSWWFKLQGVDRVLFWGRSSDIVTEVNNNKWYGRPIDFFVRTEKIRMFQEKTIEDIVINLSVKESL